MLTRTDRTTLADPLLTVVLPNFNHARYLPRAIDAILRQSRPPDELIVIDDASTDDSREVILQQQARAPLTVLFNERNLGALLTLQRGLEMAKGRYIYFAAADDEILPGFFETALRVLETTPSVGMFCGETILIDGKTEEPIGLRPVVRPLRKAGPISPERVVKLLARADNFIHTGSTVFRRHAVVEKGGLVVEAGSFSDGLLARKVAIAQGMWFEPTPVSRWFIHSTGFSRSTALDQERAVEALVAVPKWIEMDPHFPLWYSELFRRRWQFGSARLALNVVPVDRRLLDAMAPDTYPTRFLVKLLGPFLHLRLARLTLLAWLTICLKPFRIRDLLQTAIDRRIERFRR